MLRIAGSVLASALALMPTIYGVRAFGAETAAAEPTLRVDKPATSAPKNHDTEALVNTLVAGMQDDEPLIRRLSCHALCAIGPDAVPALLALLKENQPKTWGLALSTLERMGMNAKGALPLLVRLYKSEKSADRRLLLLHAIDTILSGATAHAQDSP